VVSLDQSMEALSITTSPQKDNQDLAYMGDAIPLLFLDVNLGKN